jgi:hypothetical protein
MRMHKLPIVFAALLAAPAASAQVGNAPFCLATDAAFGGEPDCTYRTWAQCPLWPATSSTRAIRPILG